MEDAEWLSSPKVRIKIGRAAQVAGTALALHVYHDGHELEAVAKCGACSEACAHVSRLPWGAQACRRSRESAGADTIRRGKPVPFICHMGFSCVSMSVEISPSEKAVLTLGPFCPSEAPGSLELDARHGIEKLERAPREDLPFSLSDIPMVSAAAVPAVAEWLAEDLNRSCRSSEDERSARAGSASPNETLPVAATPYPSATQEQRQRRSPPAGPRSHPDSSTFSTTSTGVLTKPALLLNSLASYRSSPMHHSYRVTATLPVRSGSAAYPRWRTQRA